MNSRRACYDTLRSIIALCTVAAVGVGCAGGSGTAPAPQLGPRANGKVILAISIPHRAGTAASRGPAYISASTQSIALTITHGASTVLQEAVGLTVTSNPACTGTGSSTTCTLALSLAGGSYLGTFATYDGPVVSNLATGNLLSHGQSIAISIVGGTTNTVAITLDGVPASISISPGAGSLIGGTAAGGFSVPFSAQPLVLEALDADGNIILGAGAPTFSTALTGSGASSYTVTQPSQSTPSQFTLATSTGALHGAGAVLTVTATPPNSGFSCSAAGVVCTASADIGPPHELFVSNGSNLTVYSSTDDNNWALTATNNAGIVNPVQIAIAADETLFVINANNFGPPNVSTYAPPYTAVPGSITNGISSPATLAVTPAGELLVADGATLNEYASPWTGMPVQATLASNSYDSLLDRSNNLIVDTGSSTAIYPAPSYGTSTSISSSVGGPMALNASQTLALGDNQSGLDVLLYAAPYTGSPVTITLPTATGQQTPSDLAFDENGNLWILTQSSNGGGSLFEYTQPFSSIESPAVSLDDQNGQLGVHTLAADSSGDILMMTDPNTISIVSESGTTINTITNGISYPQQLFYFR